MRRNPCGWFQTRLPLLAGDDLVGPERRDVERHLVSCSDCRQRLESLEGALGVLHIAAAVPSSAPASTVSVWPPLARQIRESRRTTPTAWPRRVAWPVAGLAASVLIAVGALALTWPEKLNRTQSVAGSLPAPAVGKPVVTAQENTSKLEDSSSDAQTARASTEPTFRGHSTAQPDPNEAQPTR